VALWIFGGSIGINAVAAAIVGLFILLVTNVTSWKECLNNNAAWDTLTWFAALIAMAAALNKYGFIPWLSNSVVQVRQSRLAGLTAVLGGAVLLFGVLEQFAGPAGDFVALRSCPSFWAPLAGRAVPIRMVPIRNQLSW
jgi:di/tricarboxylate transporter